MLWYRGAGGLNFCLSVCLHPYLFNVSSKSGESVLPRLVFNEKITTCVKELFLQRKIEYSLSCHIYILTGQVKLEIELK